MDGDPIDLLLSRAEIEDVVLRYCRGVDRLDLDLVRRCFHPDGVDDHGTGPRSIDDFVSWLGRLLPRYSMTMHLVGNVLVERVDVDAAICETYGVAFHRGDASQPRQNLTTGFRYVDRFERRDGEWRIAVRVATTEWSRVDDPASWWTPPPGLRAGRRDREDAVYRLLRGETP